REAGTVPDPDRPHDLSGQPAAGGGDDGVVPGGGGAGPGEPRPVRARAAAYQGAPHAEPEPGLPGAARAGADGVRHRRGQPERRAAPGGPGARRGTIGARQSPQDDPDRADDGPGDAAGGGGGGGGG